MMSQLYPEIIVESKQNNSELVKAVRRLEDSENKYIIVLDNAFDNLQAIMEQKRLHEFAAEKENVILLNFGKSPLVGAPSDSSKGGLDLVFPK